MGWPVGTGLSLETLIYTLAIAIVVGAWLLYLRRKASRDRRLLAAAERTAACSSQLADLTAALSRATTVGELVRAALPDILHALHAKAGSISFVVDRPPAWRVMHAVGVPVTDEVHSADSRHPTTEAIRRQELVFVGSPSERATEFPDVPPDDLLAASAAGAVIPLASGNRAIGALTVSFDEIRRFEDDERLFMLKAGRQIAQAALRAVVYEQAVRARAEGEAFRVRADAELRERQRIAEALRESEGKYRVLAARTARLYEASAALSEAVTVDAVARVIVRHGKAVVGATAGSIALVSRSGTQFETLHVDGYARQPIEAAPRFGAEPGFCSPAATESREPIYIASLDDWQKRYPRSAALAAESGYESAAVLPLFAEGAVLAVLSFHFAAPVNFTEDYTTLLRSVAQHCGQALYRARLYESAQKARAEAESANRAKDDFLSTVSHELRTPLNAIVGWASMLREGRLDPSRTSRALDAIFTNSVRQARLIEDLLDVSRIVAGHVTFDLQECRLGESLHAAVEAVMPMAEAKGLELRLEEHEDVSVVADPRRLEQVFLNLLSNAIKFTPQGGRVTVAAGMGNDVVSVRVADTGAGIDREFLPHVFERFRQGDRTTARRSGGLGLGLFIARQLIEAQGGTISVESDGPGRGATFIVTLPAHRTSDSRTPPTMISTSDDAGNRSNTAVGSPLSPYASMMLTRCQADNALSSFLNNVSPFS